MCALNLRVLSICICFLQEGSSTCIDLLKDHSVSNQPKFMKLETYLRIPPPPNYHIYWNMSLASLENLKFDTSIMYDKYLLR